MTERTHDAFDGQAALYALGALGKAERSRFEAHLEDCLECVREVKSLLPVAHHLPQTAVPVDPPPALRERVLREVAGWTPAPAERPEAAAPALGGPAIRPAPAPSPPPAPRGSGLGPLFWLVALLLVGVAGAGGCYVAELHREIADLQATAESATTRAQILELEATVAELEATRRDEVIAIATDPTVRSLTLAGQPLAPRATGRALWTESGMLAFAATGLPALPEGDTYQLWFVTPEADPVGAALLLPEADGAAGLTLQIPEETTPAAMAVTIEPAGGVPTPTGDVYLLSEP
jgi:anti-sigma-K factor RskA